MKISKDELESVFFISDTIGDVYHKFPLTLEFDYEVALRILVREEIIILIPNKTDSYSVELYVNCSDVFYWGCSDVHQISYNQIQELFTWCVVYPKWGSTIWTCSQRKMKPQDVIIEKMKNDGVWYFDDIFFQTPAFNEMVY